MTIHRTDVEVVSFDLTTLDSLGLAEVVVLDPAGRPALYLAEHRDVMAVLEAFRHDGLGLSVATEALIYGPLVTPQQDGCRE
jgi:hypothetical protein